MFVDYPHSAVEYKFLSYGEGTLPTGESVLHDYTNFEHTTHDVAVSTHARTIISWAGGTKAPRKLVYFELSKPRFRIVK